MSLQDKLEAIRQAVEARNDIAYAPLLAVLRFPCSESGSTICGVEMGLSCERCRNTGYLTRNWDGLPPGALAGALVVAAFQCGIRLSLEAAATPGPITWFQVGEEYGTPDEAACDAVLEALGMEAEATDA